MAAASSTTIVPQILDGEHDYKDWSVRVKTYLLSKDLWDVVESEPPEQGDVFKFKDSWKNNAEALHAIQLSCGSRTFPSIRDKTTAKAAWDTLEALFNREKRKLFNIQDRDEMEWRDYQDFFAAVRRGDLDETKNFLDEHDDARVRMNSLGTALHNAVIFKQERIVEELVKRMEEEELEKQSSDGWTALAYAARDNLNMVKCIVLKNHNLIGIAKEGRQMTPILIAAMHDRWDIVRYLFDLTPALYLLPQEGSYGSQLIVFCLFAKQFDFAWMLLQCSPTLAYTRGQGRYSPLSAIASVPSAFMSGTSLKFPQSLIYKCIHIEDAGSIGDFYINVESQENEQGNQGNSTGLRELIVSGFGLLQGLPSRLSDFFGISRIRKLKLTHVRSRQILDCMCDEIRQLNDEEMRDGLVYEAVYSAVQNGIVEVVIPLCKARPELLFRGLEEGKNIFQYAVECRQENVYSLIYGVGQRNLITTLRDNFGNSILHYAGMLSPLASKKLDRIAGAAFQMQREAMVQGGREYRGSTLGSLIFKQRWFDTP